MIVGEEMKLAAKMAADETEPPESRKLSHRMAQHMIDLQSKLMYAEGGIAQWENESVGLY